MAGAVSAGAYTAGVMDYLLEALEAYEKKRGTAGYPSHKIEIPVIGGASAGGMTSIITAAALQQGITPIKEPGADLMAERPENMLYHSWVDLTDEDMFAKMLETGDIKNADVESALDCRFIDEVAKRTITPGKPDKIDWRARPGYISPDLKLFTTLSNLQGFNYDVRFNSADTGVQQRPYYMALHNDYACFQLNWTKGAKTPAGWMPLNIEHGESAKQAMQSAMATGAFPVGLKAREVTRTTDVVNHDELFGPKVLPAIQLPADPPAYTTLNVDGGMINNEPFDKVRQILKKVSKQHKSADYEDFAKFKSTIIMVAPFPSTKPSVIDMSAKLLNVIGLTLSAMISQMRSRPWQIDDALARGCAGQFLIDPARKFIKPDGDPISIDGERAIACGALGGFSGFLNKNFRVHDYFLGRHNCKIFLRDYFTIADADKDANPIFSQGYKGITDTKYRSIVDGKWQLIPIVEDDVDYTFPKMFKPYDKNWPVQQPEAIDKYLGAMAKRIQAVILNIVKFKPLVKFALRIGLFLLRRKLARTILDTVKKELKTWHLMH